MLSIGAIVEQFVKRIEAFTVVCRFSSTDKSDTRAFTIELKSTKSVERKRISMLVAFSRATVEFFLFEFPFLVND